MRAAALLASVFLLAGCVSTPAPEAEAPASAIPAQEAAPPAVVVAAPPAPAPQAAPTTPFKGERLEAVEASSLPKVDRTVPPADLWQRIRQGFSMPDIDSPLVQRQTTYYAARPEYLQRMFDRSRLYLFHIVEEIEKRGLPTELALLPMVESAFNPMAYSRSHASGLWQFIPGTGRRYDLKQNWWYDGRRDIVDSTNAALDYLTAIYQMHGDWHLALASYNWGENAVARAIAKNRAAGKPTDYQSLKMPPETRMYIPKLQALKNIIANPGYFNVTLAPIPNEPYFATYDRVVDIDVQLAAKLAEMPVEEFIALNPAFSRPLIRASMTPRIVLPADKVDVFHENLAKLDEKSLVSWQTYYPKKGDTFESIAKKHRMSVAQLKEVNGISARNKVVPTMVVVPMEGSTTRLEKMPIMYAPPIPVSVRRVFHTVKQGETLPAIAKRYSVSAEDITRWNRVTKATPGQKLVLEVRAPAKGKPRKKATGKKVKTVGG
ncbi:MAG TPA: transglycosylase SLT domain-containing protein [Burkholderiales bacterium]|nr:transglycosylase SLT domain-containing protein [Burkholderiales bacterium]